MLTIILLTLVACISAVIDTIAGGGGLLTVPAMLLTGMPPLSALATNKFQATFGAGTATWQFARQGVYHWSSVIGGVVWCLFGAIIGTLLIESIQPGVIQYLIPLLLLGIWITLVFAPKLGNLPGKKRCRTSVFFCLFGLLLGAYDGFLGPGTGSFWVFAMIALLGWQFKQATMNTKLYNFVSNFGSLLVFMVGGFVRYDLGIAMAVGQMLGAYMGSHLVITRGQYLIRPLLLFMTGTMIIVLVFTNITSVHHNHTL